MQSLENKSPAKKRIPNLLTPTPEMFPFAERRLGFSYFFHGYRATLNQYMHDFEFDDFIKELSERFGDFIEQDGVTKSGILWERWWVSATGATLYANRYVDEVFSDSDTPVGMTRFHVLIAVPGTACESKSLYDIASDILWLKEEKYFKFTRIDVKIRDWERRISIGTYHEWCLFGYVRGVRTFSEIVGDYLVRKHLVIQLPQTLYMGSRQSLKYVRVYEAHLLHHAWAIDFEVEYKDEKAQQIASDISDCISAALLNSEYPYQRFSEFCERDVAVLIAGAVVTAVDFKSDCGDGLIGDWESFKKDVISYLYDDSDCIPPLKKIKGSRTKTTKIERKIAWLYRQVSSTFSVIYDSLSDELRQRFFVNFLDKGRHSSSSKLRLLREQNKVIPNDIEGLIIRLNDLGMISL